MPTGPEGEKRPADVVGNAAKVMRIATGQEDDGVDKAENRQRAGGKRGGSARSSTTDAGAARPDRRGVAAEARWKKS